MVKFVSTCIVVDPNQSLNKGFKQRECWNWDDAANGLNQVSTYIALSPFAWLITPHALDATKRAR